MTPDEKESIITEAIDRTIEKFVLMIPKIMSNVMKEQIAMNSLAKEFFDTNSDFKEHRDVVTSVVEEIETKNPGKQYSKLLEEAAPEIKRRIGTVKSLDLSTINKPDIATFKDKVSSHGDI